MKLYQPYLSPFPTRVRLMLYAKGIDAEIVTPHAHRRHSHSHALVGRRMTADLSRTRSEARRVPRTKRYWEAIASDPIAARLMKETREALLTSMGRG